MKGQVKSIDLVTANLGTFTFTKHFNTPETEAYDALVCFESNNWERLGETSYHVVFHWEDDTNTTLHIKGVNASAELSAIFDEEQAEELEKIYKDNH